MKTLSRLFGAVMCLPIAGILIALFIEFADRSGNPLAYWLALLGLSFAAVVIGAGWMLMRIISMLFADRRGERAAWKDVTNNALTTVQISQAASVEIHSAVLEGIRLGTDQQGNKYFMLPNGTNEPVGSQLSEAEQNYMAQLQAQVGQLV